jgi:hypothetical protein
MMADVAIISVASIVIDGNSGTTMVPIIWIWWLAWV